MPIPNTNTYGSQSTAASQWPSRLAFLAALIFTLASSGTNLIYGWSKGSDLGSSLVWASVSTSPDETSEIAGFAPHAWYRFREAGQALARDGETPGTRHPTAGHPIPGSATRACRRIRWH